MDNFSITQNGKPLDRDNYTIDIKNKTFYSEEDELVLDFTDINGWTFTTGSLCTFITNRFCSFTTGDSCTFDTGFSCTFTTDYECIFRTGDNCTFDTGNLCTILLYNIHTCKFKSYDNNCIILDRTDKQAYKLTKELIDMIKVINN